MKKALAVLLSLLMLLSCTAVFGTTVFAEDFDEEPVVSEPFTCPLCDTANELAEKYADNEVVTIIISAVHFIVHSTLELIDEYNVVEDFTTMITGVYNGFVSQIGTAE